MKISKDTVDEIEYATLAARSIHPHFADNAFQVISLATEELGEFAQAVNDKKPRKARQEALDLIAVLVRYLEKDK